MKILLLTVPNTHVAKATDHGNLEASDAGVFPPVGLMYVAGSLLKKGCHEVRILDPMVNHDTYEEIERTAAAYEPDLIGLTVYTPNLYDTVALCHRIRKACPKSKIVWGGPHTSLFPLESMKHTFVDYLILGEAEEIFPAFCDAVERRQSLDGIPGIVYRSATNEIRQTGDAGYVRDVDAIAFPAFELVEYKKYFSAVGSGQPMAVICSSRGCPFSCTFCCKPYATYRARSVDNILSEMALYYERGMREFFFFDDLFNINVKRVAAIARGILDKKWKIVWSFRGRVDAVDASTLSLAKQSGCRQIFFGIEAATSEGLMLIKKQITLEKAREAVLLARRAGILTSTNWIIGFPHDRCRDDIDKVINTAIQVDSDYAQFNICIAYQGTEIFKQGTKIGLWDADVWRRHALDPAPDFSEPIWEQYFTRQQLGQFLKNCYQRFYFRPKFLWRKAFQINSLSALALHVKGALALLGLKSPKPQFAHSSRHHVTQEQTHSKE